MADSDSQIVVSVLNNKNNDNIVDCTKRPCAIQYCGACIFIDASKLHLVRIAVKIIMKILRFYNISQFR